QPRVSSAERHDPELARSEIAAVEIGDLQLSARRGPERPGELDYPPVVEIEAGNCVIGLGPRWLFLEADGALPRIELHDAVALRVLDVTGKYRRSGRQPRRPAELGLKIVTVENVVAENQRTGAAVQESLSDQECLRDAFGLRLLLVRETDSPARS